MADEHAATGEAGQHPYGCNCERCQSSHFQVPAATSPLPSAAWPADAQFQLGDRVTTPRPPFWVGRICGWYRNSEGRLGFAVESEAIPLAIHIYPQEGLRHG